eukprot:513164_1
MNGSNQLPLYFDLDNLDNDSTDNETNDLIKPYQYHKPIQFVNAEIKHKTYNLLIQKPRIGDIVVINGRIGVIRSCGNVDLDTTQKYYGIELKGGSYNQRNNNRMFRREQIKIVSSEQLIDKLTEIYNINNLYDEHQLLKQEYLIKCDEINRLSLNVALFNQQICSMKQICHDQDIKLTHVSDKYDKYEDKICMSLLRNTTNTYRKSYIQNRHILCVVGFVNKYSYIFVHNDILDMIIFFYSKILVMKLSYNKTIKYNLVCPICDTWTSIQDKIPRKYSISILFRLTYSCKQIIVDAGNWKEFEWDEEKSFVVNDFSRDHTQTSDTPTRISDNPAYRMFMSVD